MATVLYFRCTECFALFETKEQMTKHLKLHKSSANLKFDESTRSQDGNNANYISQYTRWSKDMILLLLEGYKAHVDKFNDIKWTNRQVWNLVADEFLKMGYAGVKGQMCDDKWRSLKKSYFKIKNTPKSPGSRKMKFEYYSHMDEILAEKPKVQLTSPYVSCVAKPIFHYIDVQASESEAAEVVEPDEEIEAEAEVVEPDEEELENELNPRKRSLPNWYICYEKLKKQHHLERMAQRERHHRDEIDIGNQIIDLLESLKKD